MLLLCSFIAAQAQPLQLAIYVNGKYGLNVDTNGVLIWNTNFFAANSNLLNAAVGGGSGGGGNDKVPTNNGTAFGLTMKGPITNADLTANRVLILDSAKRQTNSTVTDTELGYVGGVTSGIQAQLNGKAAQTDLTTVSNNVNTVAGNLTSVSNTMTGKLTISSNLSDLNNVSTARSNIGVVDVDSIAALRALNPATIKRYVIVGGYYTLGDCLPSVFIWNSSGSTATNFGTIFKDSAEDATGRWQRVYNTSAPVFDVRWFGAKGDGSTDDLARVDAAENTIGALGGGTLYIPRGTYMFSAAWTIGSSNLKIVGDGPSLTTLKSSAVLNTWVVISASDVSVEGVFFDGNNKVVDPVYLNTYIARPKFRNCWFKNAKLDDTFYPSGGGRGALVSADKGVLDAKFIDCVFDTAVHTDFGGTPTHAGERVMCGIFFGVGQSTWASSADTWQGLNIESCRFSNIDANREGYAICLENHQGDDSRVSIINTRADVYGERFIKVLADGGTISTVQGVSYDTNASSHILIAGRHWELSNFKLEGDGEHGVVVSNPYTNLYTADVHISHGTILFTTNAFAKNNRGVTLTTYGNTSSSQLSVDDVFVANAAAGVRLEGNIQDSWIDHTTLTNGGDGIIVTQNTNAWPNNVRLGQLITLGTVTNGFNILGGTNISRGPHGGTALTPVFRQPGVTGKFLMDVDNSLGALAAGDTVQYDGTNFVLLPKGSNGQVLTAGTDTNSWQNLSGAPVGTMVSSGSWSSGDIPQATDATGTNFAKATLTGSGAVMKSSGPTVTNLTRAGLSLQKGQQETEILPPTGTTTTNLVVDCSLGLLYGETLGFTTTYITFTNFPSAANRDRWTTLRLIGNGSRSIQILNSDLSFGTLIATNNLATGETDFTAGWSGNQKALVQNPMPELSGVTSPLQAQIDAKAAATAIDNTAYDATGWNGVTNKAPTQDAVRDLAVTLAKSVDVQVYTTPGTATWTNLSGAKWVEVTAIGGGGGGGSGRRGPSGTAQGGGAGGAAGGHSVGRFNAASLSATVTVTVGGGGAGAAAKTGDGQDGANGTSGTNSTFGAYIAAGGGGGGNGGTSATGGTINAGSRSVATYVGNSGGAGGAGSNAGSGTGGTSSVGISGGGGGGGGGLTGGGTADTPGTGGNLPAIYPTANSGGGAAGQTGVNSGNGGNGNDYTTGIYFPGAGGGGGKAGSAVAGGSGGNGGLYGGGGGGGACSFNTFNSGAGGNGGNGVVVVITYF